MLSHFVYASAAGLALVSAYLAVRLTRMRGASIAWSVLAAALLLMGANRMASWLADSLPRTAVLATPAVKSSLMLASSTLMLIAIVVLRRRLVDAQGHEAQAQQRLRESELRHRTFVENSAVGLYRTTPSGRVLMANPALARMLGYDSVDEFMTRDCEADPVYATGDRAEFRERIERDGVIQGWQSTWRRRDGREVPVNENAWTVRGPDGRVAYYEGTVEDVSTRRALEEQLHSAHKMEAVGRLAGGIAHDFNNTLMAVMGYGEKLRRRMGGDAAGRADVDEVLAATRRAAVLVRKLLAVGRRQVLQPRVIDLNAVVDGMRDMLRRVLGEDVELVVLRARELGHVRADPGQTEQVLLNLALNARDAMPRGGHIVIETANVVIDAPEKEEAPIRPGRYVAVSLTDTGSGMDEETRRRLFEPFFTTKEAWRGTGLGLASVYGTVQQSGGSIRVQSSVGRGTTIRILLPRVDEPLDAEAPAPAAPPLLHGCAHETVLVVEDEPVLRELIDESLREAGYTVLLAPHGEAALDLAAAHGARIDLVISDVVMPRLGGPELVRRLAAVRPALRVLFMSGYSEEAVAHHGALEPGTEFLEKPFAPDALVRRVRGILDAPVPVEIAQR